MPAWGIRLAGLDPHYDRRKDDVEVNGTLQEHGVRWLPTRHQLQVSEETVFGSLGATKDGLHPIVPNLVSAKKAIAAREVPV
jgi:hypothetical protein